MSTALPPNNHPTLSTSQAEGPHPGRITLAVVLGLIAIGCICSFGLILLAAADHQAPATLAGIAGGAVGALATYLGRVDVVYRQPTPT